MNKMHVCVDVGSVSTIVSSFLHQHDIPCPASAHFKYIRQESHYFTINAMLDPA